MIGVGLLFVAAALDGPARLSVWAAGNVQLTVARDSYSYLHLPLVAGIILFPVGAKKTLGDVGEPLKLYCYHACTGPLKLADFPSKRLPAPRA